MGLKRNSDNTMLIAGCRGVVKKMYCLVNDNADKGFVVCNIILSSGAMIPVKLPESCKIKEIYVHDGQSVRNGDPLVKIAVA